MKIKTSEILGPALNWAVAVAAKKLPISHLPSSKHFWSPSTIWAQGGPIIDREKIKVAPNLGGTWSAQIRHTKDHPLVAHPVLTGWTNKHGPTPLIAAMRCYCASVLGDEVDVPEELLK